MVPEDERGVSACLRRVRLSGTSRDQAPANQSQRAQSQLLLDLFLADSQLNVDAGEPEVRPPGAPTTPAVTQEREQAVRDGSSSAD